MKHGHATASSAYSEPRVFVEKTSLGSYGIPCW